VQRRARELSQLDQLLILCGRYEGYDERIRQAIAWDEVSVGDFVLAGGELAALSVLEAAVRLIPGVLGCAQSPELESFENGLLDYPQYTRPREYRGMKVPEVLVSGDHQAVARWRLEQARLLTARRNSDHALRNNEPTSERP
jgi:tRNA (guanine37-N1)-methyltransferase